MLDSPLMATRRATREPVVVTPAHMMHRQVLLPTAAGKPPQVAAYTTDGRSAWPPAGRVVTPLSATPASTPQVGGSSQLSSAAQSPMFSERMVMPLSSQFAASTSSFVSTPRTGQPPMVASTTSFASTVSQPPQSVLLGRSFASLGGSQCGMSQVSLMIAKGTRSRFDSAEGESEVGEIIGTDCSPKSACYSACYFNPDTAKEEDTEATEATAGESMGGVSVGNSARPSTSSVRTSSSSTWTYPAEKHTTLTKRRSSQPCFAGHYTALSGLRVDTDTRIAAARQRRATLGAPAEESEINLSGMSGSRASTPMGRHADLYSDASERYRRDKVRRDKALESESLDLQQDREKARQVYLQNQVIWPGAREAGKLAPGQLRREQRRAEVLREAKEREQQELKECTMRPNIEASQACVRRSASAFARLRREVPSLQRSSSAQPTRREAPGSRRPPATPRSASRADVR
eukprot:TRINITY_DN13051_c0_g1_i2.p1 TRINITY_DN13051_c0_g1~~TRINITY_DN13051_c0_g1_i2.p1  ORF type:complete len:462 (-),score=78.12 TRINITY_DN13051_c0_g1_i2:151-1536(-)